jgi:hypothetical protein
VGETHRFAFPVFGGFHPPYLVERSGFDTKAERSMLTKTNAEQLGSVFISYSHTDREACIALRAELEKAGLSVFRDEDDIRTGDGWMTKLEQALQSCRAFVVLIGRDGVQRWVGPRYKLR